ncbi:centrosome-associated protein 350 isoform X2 [Takifugu rubripes]|uniref:centrosome-associated protein 350 isoform X2 n=1 Tax=Takifugu rubripes TaxID=31033 RepID=UPI0011454469|nr:centrosome-associated protein 350 isoform X2 [Takifugu rubripes]
MESSRWTDGLGKSSAPQLTDHNTGTELTATWKGVVQSKTALRHIENRQEAAPGTGVFLDFVMDISKKKSSRAVHSKDDRMADDKLLSKHKWHSQQSPDKSSSRSPLKNTTQDGNVCGNNRVEFREPLPSYREATHPPQALSHPKSRILQSVPDSCDPSSLPASYSLPSQPGHQGDSRDKHKDGNVHSTHSTPGCTHIHYLNDQPALDRLVAVGQSQLHERTDEDHSTKAQSGGDNLDISPSSLIGTTNHRLSIPSSSPGSASQRLENLRRHQHDDKLERLKERIRRQRQHLQDTAESEKLLGPLERPIATSGASNSADFSSMAKIRKVAPAPPPPVYRGFNSTETKIQTPDGKVWKEQEFHDLSREIYRDLSRQFAETTRSRLQQQREQTADRSKERRPTKPVRKVHRVASGSDPNTKPVISPASWREGQKRVKMILGPAPKSTQDDRSQLQRGFVRTASHHRPNSDQPSDSTSQTHTATTERHWTGPKGQKKQNSIPSPAELSQSQAGVTAESLSADIQGILDDLQLEYKMAEKEKTTLEKIRDGRSGKRSRGRSSSQPRAPFSAWGATVTIGHPSTGCRSASPSTRQKESASARDAMQKKRHYDADTVRQYISRQKEERKRREVEEKRALREQEERRNQRLQELYRKQREVAKMAALPNESPVHKGLQGTYTKLQEEAQLEERPMWTQLAATQMRPIYQPSGESDKENKRLGAPQSPSSSERSLSGQQPLPLSTNDLDVTPLFLPAHLSPAGRPATGPSSDHLLSQLLRMEPALTVGDINPVQQPATVASSRSHKKMSRIEFIKSTAVSLSNRLEYEARRIAGEGINYGTVTSVDVDTALAPGPSQGVEDDQWWIGATENDKIGHRTNRSHASFNGTGLPGSVSQPAFNGQKEMSPQSHSDLPQPILTHQKQERKLVNGLEMPKRRDKMAQLQEYEMMEEKSHTDPLDSSAGSISEGPLLSEGSFSEDEAVPPHFKIAASHLDAHDNCAGQTKDGQRLSEFQREAAKFSALNSVSGQHGGGKSALDELSKGSPTSIVNIFTKNLPGNIRVNERNSPLAFSAQSANSPLEAEVYEDDFVSLPSSEANGQLKRSSDLSTNNHFEDLMRSSPPERSTGDRIYTDTGDSSHQSPYYSSGHSPHLSSGSASGSSPFSRHSSRKKGAASDHSDGTLVEEQRSSCSPPSEPSFESWKRGSSKSSVNQSKSIHSNDTSEKSSHKGKKRRAPRSSQVAVSRSGAMRIDSPLTSNTSTCSGPHGGKQETHTAGELQYSPAALKQRMAAELQYLESIEESMRQLGDVERLLSVSVAQQESASLAQMLQAKQQRQEQELLELKIKAEREAMEAQLQLEANRQTWARAHIELQEGLTGVQKQTLEGLQEATVKMITQQAEAVQHTADAAKHIKEMTELARSQITGAVGATTAATHSSLLDKQDRHESSHSKHQHALSPSESFQSEISSRKIRLEDPPSSANSPNDSLSSFRKSLHSGESSGSHCSPSHASVNHGEQIINNALQGTWRQREAEARKDSEAGSSSIEEEVLTVENDSLCSENITSVNDKVENTLAEMEYSLKFDESMTEDEIEQRSFRSLLPSEAHRRGNKDKSRHHEESEDDAASQSMALVPRTHNILKDANMAFSNGQDSFSQFTMDMVRQYMKDEQVRLQHQSSLLHLRQKALKEKTKTELAWLEHQKKRLRDKGEDDKMPPIRKKQRGLLMKHQQEQAEIRRLQEANKAARKESQLLLKQQEEIERMRNSTIKLRERLKIAGGNPPPETTMSETSASEAAASTTRHAEDIRSPSPSLSISGSETSSIMQKLRKMRSHMDENHCSPVHYFFSLFTAHHWASLSVCLPNLHPKFQLFIYNQLVRFLTKREQQLKQRRHHAEELLEWKQLLDQEEADVRRMEKEALAVWNKQKPQDKDGLKIEISDISHSPSHHQNSEPRTDSEKDYGSEGDQSPVTPESSIHTEVLGSQHTGSPSSVQSLPVTETPLASIQESPANYTQDFTSASQSNIKQSPQGSSRGSNSPTASPSERSSKTKMQLCSSSRNNTQTHTQPTGSQRVSQFEPISDQSDIETRIKALKEELKKRKFMAYQLKKEQKKRQKERLKAQEANLLKQLQSYDKFIEKTKAELNKKSDTANLHMQDSKSFGDESSVKAPAQSSDSIRTQIDASLHSDVLPQLDHSKATSVPETVTPTPVHDNPESLNSESKGCLSAGLFRPSSRDAQMIESGDESINFNNRSDLQQDIVQGVRSQSEDQHTEQNLTLEKEDSLEQEYFPSSSRAQDDQVKKTEISKTKEAGISDIITSAVSDLSEINHENKVHPSCTFSSGPHSHSPDLGPVSKKEDSKKDAKASSSIANEYDDDFELSVCSSPREEHHHSKPASHTSASPAESKLSSGHLSSREEEDEIDEELAQFSENSKGSNQSERLLDILNKTEDSIADGKDVGNSIYSPPIPVTQAPPPPVVDEMSSFKIGDRVLVGCVQPGRLRFKGPTSFANGFWAGVELDKSEGSNNGTYDGVLYFVCEENHGIFAPPDKITHLPDKFEIYTDTAEDDESFFDDPPGKRGVKDKPEEDKSTNQNLKKEKDQTSQDLIESENNNDSNQSVFQAELGPHSQQGNLSEHPISNGAVLDLKDLPHNHHNSGMDVIVQAKELGNLDQKVVLLEEDINTSHLATELTNDGAREKVPVSLDTFADTLLNSFVNDIVTQFAEIKRAKEQKIVEGNQANGDLVGRNEEERIVGNKDGLPFFLPAEQEELSSPELCNRPESPILGPSGQEELAKRLAELELSRELLNDIGDDQDWFDEDFGLSSRREQQQLKKKEEEARLGRVAAGEKAGVCVAVGGLVSSPAIEQQVRIPPRPELPLPLPPKLPEQPAMVVPHSAAELEKMVHAATQEIWEVCGLDKDRMLTQAHLPAPKPSQEYLGEEASGQDQEAVCIRSYKQAVYDFTWEILQEIYTEDPNINQPQWVKPRRGKSSYYRVKTQRDVIKTQEFIAAEVLKLYGLTKDHSQKTDWQKMLKFGRKKRDRVDQILVQELHEEEAQWVNYDEDELFVKMQLADSIFDALLKDTVSVLNEIYEKKVKRKGSPRQLS